MVEYTAGQTEQFRVAGTPVFVGGYVLGHPLVNVKLCNAEPVTVAGWLNTAGHADTTVVPTGTFGPVTVAPTKTALHPVTVAAVEPAIVATFRVTERLDGTVAGAQLALATVV